MFILKDKRNILRTLAFMVIIALGVVLYFIYTQRSSSAEKQAPQILTRDPSPEASSTPCVVQRAPDGSMVPVCMPNALSVRLGEPIRIVPGPESPSFNQETPGLVSAGTGTTTLKKTTPFNDILIAETGSPYATLRNARYTMWPYPGEVAFKEVYIMLPDAYEPIFPGYSNDQFIEASEGMKHIMIYLRYKQSAEIGSDTKIFVQSPITTDASDHPLTLFESTNTTQSFSLVSKGKEAIVEVTFTTPLTATSSDSLRLARKELLQDVEHVELVW